MASDAPGQVLSSSDNPVAVKDIKNEPEVPDVSLLDFCAQLDDYTPTVSIALSCIYLCWHSASYIVHWALWLQHTIWFYESSR